AGVPAGGGVLAGDARRRLACLVSAAGGRAAACGASGVEHVLERAEAHVPPAEVVHELSPQDGEQVRLDARVLAEGREPLEEVEERILDDVLGVGGLPQPAPRERQ